MDKHDEDAQVEHAAERLEGHFPDVDPTHVEQIVEEVHAEFDGRPVRDFVPVLVEHEARERLLAEGDTEQINEPTDDNGPLTEGEAERERHDDPKNAGQLTSEEAVRRAEAEYGALGTGYTVD